MVGIENKSLVDIRNDLLEKLSFSFPFQMQTQKLQAFMSYLIVGTFDFSTQFEFFHQFPTRTI